MRFQQGEGPGTVKLHEGPLTALILAPDTWMTELVFGPEMFFFLILGARLEPRRGEGVESRPLVLGLMPRTELLYRFWTRRKLKQFKALCLPIPNLHFVSLIQLLLILLQVCPQNRILLTEVASLSLCVGEADIMLQCYYRFTLHYMILCSTWFVSSAVPPS